jgi:mannose-6-phosphate isomerase-like protein (cupin superfamily)
MRAEIRKATATTEFATPERCHITEIANDTGDTAASIARARVEPGVTTAWHLLKGIDERYIIIAGNGRVEIGDHAPVDVSIGDVVRIPANTHQRITNTGANDLVFYAVCTPPFNPGCYVGV